MIDCQCKDVRLWSRVAGGIVLALALAACAERDAPGVSGLAGPGAFRWDVEPGGEVDSSFGDYLAGNYALDTGELADAATYFENALAENPDNLDLLRQVYLLTLADGRYDKALQQAKLLVELDPEAEEAHLLLALEQARANQFDAAREPLRGLGDRGIAGLAAPFLDAWAIFGSGGPRATDDALDRLDAGESLGPLNNFHSAMLLDLGGQVDEAEAALSSSLPATGPAPVRIVQAYASVLARQDQRDEAMGLVSEQLAERGEQPILTNALIALKADQMPEPPFSDATGGMADALLGIAEALHQERGSARAVLYARLSLFLRPDLAEGSLLIGDILAEQENYDGAIEVYETVSPDSPMAYSAGLRTANALHSMERPEEAYDRLDDLAEKDPGRIEALVQLGNLLRRDEEYERAEVAYSEAIDRIQQPEREHWTLYYARGISYERTKRWPDAEADFLYALELEPEQPFVLNYLGYSWVDMGTNYDQAKGMLNRAVELRPNDGFIVDSLGWVHYRLGEYNDAVDQLERAVELEPGDPVINDHLGDAYWRVGRQREARYQWRRALSFDPEDDVEAQIVNKLKSGLPDPDLDRS